MSGGRTGTTFGSRKHQVALVLILLFAVFTRVGWLVHIRDSHPGATRGPDSASYVQPARALVEDGSFNLRPGSDAPMYERTPGYPTLIASVFAVDESETLFLLAQALLSCLTILLAFVIARRLWSPTVGVVAAAIVAVEPLQFAASGSLLTESVFSLALLATVAVGFRVFAGTPRPKWCLLLGVAVALATSIRPTTYYLPVFVIVLLLVTARRFGLKPAAIGIGVFLLPFVVLIGGWQIRNHEDVGSWRYSGIEARDLYQYRAADALARADGISRTAALRRLDDELSANPLARCSRAHGCVAAHPTRPGSFYDELSSRGIDVVTAHPVQAVESSVRGLGREVFGPGTETVGRYLDVRGSTPLKLALSAGLLLFYVALAYGLFLVIGAPRGRAVGHVFALGVAAYIVLVSAGPEAYARFRGPIMPILALYAALGVTTAIRRVRGAWEDAPVGGLSRPRPNGHSTSRRGSSASV